MLFSFIEVLHVYMYCSTRPKLEVFNRYVLHMYNHDCIGLV